LGANCWHIWKECRRHHIQFLKGETFQKSGILKDKIDAESFPNCEKPISADMAKKAIGSFINFKDPSAMLRALRQWPYAAKI